MSGLQDLADALKGTRRQQVDLSLGQVPLNPTIQTAGRYQVAVQAAPKDNEFLQLSRALQKFNPVLEQFGQYQTAQGAREANIIPLDDLIATAEHAISTGTPLDTDVEGLFSDFGKQKAYSQTLYDRLNNSKIAPKLHSAYVELFNTTPEQFAAQGVNNKEDLARVAGERLVSAGSYYNENILKGDNFMRERHNMWLERALPALLGKLASNYEKDNRAFIQESAINTNPISLSASDEGAFTNSDGSKTEFDPSAVPGEGFSFPSLDGPPSVAPVDPSAVPEDDGKGFPPLGIPGDPGSIGAAGEPKEDPFAKIKVMGWGPDKILKKQKLGTNGVNLFQPSDQTRKAIAGAGGSVFLLDLNKSGNEMTNPLVVHPDNASKEQIDASKKWAKAMAVIVARVTGRKVTSRVISTTANERGRSNAFHLEPFSIMDEKMLEWIKSDAGRKEYADTLNEFLRRPLDNANFFMPHSPGAGGSDNPNTGDTEESVSISVLGSMLPDGDPARIVSIPAVELIQDDVIEYDKQLADKGIGVKERKNHVPNRVLGSVIANTLNGTIEPQQARDILDSLHELRYDSETEGPLKGPLVFDADTNRQNALLAARSYIDRIENNINGDNAKAAAAQNRKGIAFYQGEISNKVNRLRAESATPEMLDDYSDAVREKLEELSKSHPSLINPIRAEVLKYLESSLQGLEQDMIEGSPTALLTRNLQLIGREGEPERMFGKLSALTTLDELKENDAELYDIVKKEASALKIDFEDDVSIQNKYLGDMNSALSDVKLEVSNEINDQFGKDRAVLDTPEYWEDLRKSVRERIREDFEKKVRGTSEEISNEFGPELEEKVEERKQAKRITDFGDLGYLDKTTTKGDTGVTVEGTGRLAVIDLENEDFYDINPTYKGFWGTKPGPYDKRKSFGDDDPHKRMVGGEIVSVNGVRIAHLKKPSQVRRFFDQINTNPLMQKTVLEGNTSRDFIKSLSGYRSYMQSHNTFFDNAWRRQNNLDLEAGNTTFPALMLDITRFGFSLDQLKQGKITGSRIIAKKGETSPGPFAGVPGTTAQLGGTETLNMSLSEDLGLNLKAKRTFSRFIYNFESMVSDDALRSLGKIIGIDEGNLGDFVEAQRAIAEKRFGTDLRPAATAE